MRIRSHLPRRERFARSQLAKVLHDQSFLCGSLVTMHRVCGKPGCKCLRGEPHPGLYLAIRVGGTRKMIHVPSALEERVRHWVTTYQEIWRLMEEVSGSCLQRFLKEKEKWARVRRGQRRAER